MKRKYAQVYNVAGTDPRTSSARIYHGAKGDFNGDGKIELVLSYGPGNDGFLALFLNDGGNGPGTPALKRIY